MKRPNFNPENINNLVAHRLADETALWLYKNTPYIQGTHIYLKLQKTFKSLLDMFGSLNGYEFAKKFETYRGGVSVIDGLGPIKPDDVLVGIFAKIPKYIEQAYENESYKKTRFLFYQNFVTDIDGVEHWKPSHEDDIVYDTQKLQWIIEELQAQNKHVRDEK